MPSFCVVSNCELKYSQSENVSFHKFPLRSPTLLSQWIKFTDRGSDWKPSRWSAICSRHFTESDFREYLSRKCLKKNAVPSLQAKTNDISYETYHIQMHSNDNVQIARSEPETIEDLDQTSDKQIHREYCGLCGTLVDHLLYNAFGSLDDYDINTMYHKCLPTIRIPNDEGCSRIICRECITQLQQYSKFVDRVLAHQRNFDAQPEDDDLEMIDEHPKKPIITSDTLLNIKQEPINVKQEHSDTLNKRQMIEIKTSIVTKPKDVGIMSQINLRKQTGTILEYNQPLDEPRSVSNNCEIMEIITLNNPVIDLAAEENTANVNLKVESSRATLEQLSSNIECEHSYARPKTYNLKQETTDKVVVEHTESDIESYDINFEDIDQNESNEPNEHGPINFTCHKCEKVFDSEKLLAEHLTQTNCVISKICPICSSEFKSVVEYLKHKTKEHSSRTLQCRKCMRKMKTYKLLESHERLCRKSSSKDFYFNCRHCRKQMNSISQMNKHLKHCSGQHETGNENQPTNVIGSGVSVVQNLHVPIYDAGSSAIEEAAIIHQDEPSTSVDSNTIPTDVISDLKSFELKGTNTIDNGMKQSFKVTVEDSKFIFVNEHSDKLDSELVNTIATHPVSAAKFGCEICGHTFSVFSALKQHRLTHEAERKFSCSLCPKTFKGMSGVKQHISSFHYKIKPYTCQVCNYSYALKGDMQRCRHSRLKQRGIEPMTNA